MIVSGVQKCDYCQQDVHWNGFIREACEVSFPISGLKQPDVVTLNYAWHHGKKFYFSGHCPYCQHPFGTDYTVDSVPSVFR